MSLHHDYFLPHSFAVLILLCVFSLQTVYSSFDGPQSLAKGKDLFSEKRYKEASGHFWNAIILHSAAPPDNNYNVQDVFQQFMQCYMMQNELANGFAFVSLESYKRGQRDMGFTYLQHALEADPTNEAALAVKRQFLESVSELKDDFYHDSTGDSRLSKESIRKDDSFFPLKSSDETTGRTPEELYEIASTYFSKKDYENCADIFEISCRNSGNTLGPSCANAVYCRSLIADWGFNGTQFNDDMDRIRDLTEEETARYRVTVIDEKFGWQRSTSVHPHMMLSYPIETVLKRYSAESSSYLDEKMARAGHGTNDGQIPTLPIDMPFDVNVTRQLFLRALDKRAKINVGFVGSGFNSKAVLYLSQDMFRFFNRTKFEIHIFSFGPADNPLFIKHGMGGVDWRRRVISNVDHFHDCHRMKLNHIEAARYIYNKNISILIDWDGFARQGERAQGLFALRPAPIQILHQEYLGTSGAQYIDYLFTDVVTSPVETSSLYTEKLIYMPNHFFSKGHAFQDEVKKPTYQYEKPQNPYQFGTGTPQQNKCLVVSANAPSFVFCNFNKILKANPAMVRSWIQILRQVPDSIICLLENPVMAIPYFRRFVHEAAALPVNTSLPLTNNESFLPFVPRDGDELNSRIHFIPWEKNPFDHQARNQDLCNVMLDSHPYNGHTVAQDALYGGVPIVTRSDGIDMSSRVTTSANEVLGLSFLNAYNGSQQYEEIAISLAKNKTFYINSRRILIDTCLQRNPMHPYWDVARYVKNFEGGLTAVWESFLQQREPQHVFIKESEKAAKGTFDSEVLANPTERTERKDWNSL